VIVGTLIYRFVSSNMPSNFSWGGLVKLHYWAMAEDYIGQFSIRSWAEDWVAAGKENLEK
jgi:hypothetical protein